MKDAVFARGRRRSVRETLRDGAHLAVLSAFALAQPLFDLLARTPEFLAVRDLTRWDIGLFAVAVTLLPAVAVVLAELLAGLLHPGLRASLHVAAVGFLSALVAAQVVKRLADLPPTAFVLTAGIAGAAAAFAYVRLAIARSFLTVLAPAPLVFLGMFLFASPVAKLALGGEADVRLVRAAAETPVVVVVLDEMSTVSLMSRNGEIDERRYPNFAALARDSTWFRDATTVSAWTVNAVPALLTGRIPERGQLPLFADHPDNLFTLLGGSYRLRVSEPLTKLCPRDLCHTARESFERRTRSLVSDVGLVYLHLVLPDDLRERLPSVSTTWGNFWTDPDDAAPRKPARTLTPAERRKRKKLVPPVTYEERDAGFDRFIRSLRREPGPSLTYLHLMLPHVPWEYLPSGRRYGPRASEIPGFRIDTWGGDEFLVEQGYQRYLLQVGYVDRLLGRLVRRLRAVGLYDRALLILTADHGVSFRASDRRRGFTDANLSDVAFVPFFVKEPHQRRGAVALTPVRTLDVVPTIADVLEISLRWKLDGESVFEAKERDRLTFTRRGERFTADLDRLRAMRDASLARQVGLFSDGAWFPALFEIGPHQELLGAAVGGLGRANAGGVRARVDEAASFASIDFRSSYIPTRVIGRILGDASRGTRDLAVAVNGRISAVATSYRARGEERFSVVIPESAFRDGANRIEVFSVTTRGGTPVLSRLGP